MFNILIMPLSCACGLLLPKEDLSVNGSHTTHSQPTVTIVTVLGPCYALEFAIT